jgi:ribosomal protein S18 acetylase RimI-like enzyme
MTGPIRIREAREGDAHGMAHAFVTSWRAGHRGQIPDHLVLSRTYESSERGWNRWFATRAAGGHGRECLYVAESEDGIVGVALGGPAHPPGDYPIADVYLLYVLPEYQGPGVGRRLVAALARHLAEEGMGSMWIRVLKVNMPARGFYEAIGGRLQLEMQIEDEGVTLDLVVYEWPEIWTLFSNEPAGIRPDC